MRLTRHAKNRARHLGATLADVERVIDEPIDVDRDENGKPQYIGYINDVRVRAVVALDEPDLIVTIHERKR